MRKYATALILEATTSGLDRLGKGSRLFQKSAHRHSFVYMPKAGFIYVRSRMISSRCNDNYDEFPAEEIRKGWRSFIGKPVFVNHKNDKIEEARGVIIDAALHDDINPDGSPDLWVEGLMEVDAVNYPRLAERVLAGDIDRTSMGCDVDFSVCSACGNKAYTPLDYCQHIPKMKGLKLHRRNASTGAMEDVLIREICYGLRFFENSLLVEDPADPTAFFTGVDDRGVGGGYQGDLPKAASKMANEQGRMIDGHGKPVTYDEASLRARIEDLKYYGGNGPDYVRGVNDAIRDAMRYIGFGDLETANYWLDRAEETVRDRIERNRKSIEEYVPGQRYQNQPWLDVPPSPMGGPLSKGGAMLNKVGTWADQYVDNGAPWRTLIDIGQDNIYDFDTEEEAVEDYLAMSESYGDGYNLRLQRRVNGEWVTVDPPAGVSFRPEADWPVAASKTASKLGYGERTAPPEIDTLRDEKCPVCGETDGFSGERCMICNYVKPPDPFMDPDLEVAQQVDLRQDQNQNQGVDNTNEQPPAPSPALPLECDQCKATFDGKTDAVRDQVVDQGKGDVVSLSPEDDTNRVPGPRQSPDQTIDETGRVEVEVRDGSPSPDAPTAEDLDTNNALPKPKTDSLPKGEDAPDSKAQPKAGDACPNCGQGTLQPKAPQDTAQNPDEAKPVDEPPGENKPPFMKDDAPKPEGDEPPENKTDKPNDPVEDEESPTKDRKPKKESTVREALRAIQALQIRSQSQQEQIDVIAKAAGMTPQIQAIAAKGAERLGRLQRTADEANPAQPVPTPPAEAPTTTTAEEIAPISPMSPAGGSLGNEVTTPGPTTETDVAPDAQTNLLDPVAAALRDVVAAQDYTGSTADERVGYSRFVHTSVRRDPQGRLVRPVDFQSWKRHTATQRTADAILDEPLDLNELDVTKPVAGTEGPRPIEEVRIETEVRQTDSNDGTNDINSAQGVPGVNDTPPQKVGAAEPPSAEERFYACQRLARLRIMSGIETGDELALGQKIASSPITNEAVVTEIGTLEKVLSNNSANNPTTATLTVTEGTAVAPRHLVPRAASMPTNADKLTPSLSAGVTVPVPSLANGPSSDEFLFE